MRYAIAVLLLALSVSGADARGHYRHFVRHHVKHYHHHVKHYARLPAKLPGPCRVAASMGGPCGCWAAYVLLGRLDHVWHGINLWLAQDWADRFPHVKPEQADAVVWPYRHVAPVVAGTYDGHSVMVRDSWATHRVRTAGLVFVRARRPEGVRYAGAVPL